MNLVVPQVAHASWIPENEHAMGALLQILVEECQSCALLGEKWTLSSRRASCAWGWNAAAKIPRASFEKI